jgi:predicted aspartyl protease
MHFKLLLAVILQSAVSLTQPLLGGATTQPTSQPSVGVMAEFPLGHWRQAITIPIVWGGKPACFLFDTGSDVTVLSANDFPDLKLVDNDIDMRTVGGHRTVQLFHPPDLHVGPCSLADSGPVSRLDLSDLIATIDRPVIGVLGFSAIKEWVVQIDFDERKLRFLRHDDQPHPEWGKLLPMELDAQHSLAVVLNLVGIDRRIEIDTGSDGCIDLPSDAFDRLSELSKQPVFIRRATTANGEALVRMMRLPEIKLAGSRYQGIICGEAKYVFGALGLDFFERHLATIDFPGRRLYLKPGKEFDHRDEEPMSGLWAGRRGHQLIASFVDEGGAAYLAGLRTGYVLLELNGKPASDYDVFAANDLMRSGDGKEMTITFRHGGEQKTVRFKLHRFI